MLKHRVTTAEHIRRQIKEAEGKYWRQTDFSSLPPAAVNQALSRLARTGELERVSKGLYYRSRNTKFGHTRPSLNEIQQLPIKQQLHPAGVTAASLLGFTTQNSIQGEFAISANSAPRTIIGNRARLHTRRPTTWDDLCANDAALLDFLRLKGRLSELPPTETKRRLLAYFKEGERFKRLAEVAETEPPRVRAMIGAIGQEIGKNTKELDSLRRSLNPVSKFDFGTLRNLRYAKQWQAK